MEKLPISAASGSLRKCMLRYRCVDQADRWASVGRRARRQATAQTLKLALLTMALLYAAWFAFNWSRELRGATGLLNSDGSPLAGDFINMWSAAKMALGGSVPDIYLAKRFMAFERTIIPADIGLRLWAYPPHSLLFVWPLGLIGFLPAFVVWSALGFAALVFGARRLGLDWIETAILVLCPAALQCLYYGQTGNLATGLLLVALSGRRNGDPASVLATALLTMKPQVGFLMPVLWLVGRQWQSIAWTSAIVLVMLGLTLALFGPGPWRDYVGDTLAMLNRLEREGSGPFIMMVPSTFMSLRILTGDGQLAGWLHWVTAAAVVAALGWRLVKVSDPLRQAAMILVATVLVTPYLHNYDLAILTAGALLVARRFPTAETPLVRQLNIAMVLILAWGMAHAVVRFNWVGLPIAPLLVLPLLFLA
jgi:alpha-1,2-mannosyltransferase